MANLGSDVVQLFSHLERGDTRLATSAGTRAQKIITELLAHEELEGRIGEIEILRDIVNDALSEKRFLEVSKNELEDYFLPFSLRVVQKL